MAESIFKWTASAAASLLFHAFHSVSFHHVWFGCLCILSWCLMWLWWISEINAACCFATFESVFLVCLYCAENHKNENQHKSKAMEEYKCIKYIVLDSSIILAIHGFKCDVLFTTSEFIYLAGFVVFCSCCCTVHNTGRRKKTQHTYTESQFGYHSMERLYSSQK